MCQKLAAQPKGDILVLYHDPIQLIYRSRFSRFNLSNLIQCVRWLREGCAFNERFPKERKKGTIGKYRYNCFLEMVRWVSDSLNSLLIWLQSSWLHLTSSFSLAFHTLFWRSLFSYIATWNASQLSTWTITISHLDACPIKALREVVECAISCEDTVQGSFNH